MSTGPNPGDAPPPALDVLAFDFGLARIGVAHGNSISRSAQPLAIIRAQDDDGRFRQIATLIDQWRPRHLVVGRPLHPDGAAHAMTARCERFARQLEGRFALPVTLVDERYSSAEAQSRAREAGSARGRRGASAGRPGTSLDDQAAALILEQFWNGWGV